MIRDIAGAFRLTLVGLLLVFPIAELAAGSNPVSNSIESQVASQVQAVTGDTQRSGVVAGIVGSIYSRMVKLDLVVPESGMELSFARHQTASNLIFEFFRDGMLVAWDIERGSQIAELQIGRGATPIYFFPNGQLLARDSEFLNILTVREKNRFVSDRLFAEQILEADVAADGGSIFVVTKSKDIVCLTNGGKVIWRSKLRSSLGIARLAVAQNGAAVALLYADGVAELWGLNGKRIWEGHKVLVLGEWDKSTNLSMIRGDQEIVSLSGHGVESKPFLGRPPENLRRISNLGSSHEMMGVTSDGQLWISKEDKNWALLDTGVKEAFFVNPKRYLIIKSDGVSQLKEIGRQDYLLAIIHGSSGWVVVDHEGRYDGTVEGSKDIKWSGGGSEFTLEQFFDAYYQPGLLAAYAKGDEIESTRAVSAKLVHGVFLPPKVELDIDSSDMQSGKVLSVVAVAESQGGDLTEDIRLFHNGKRLPAKARIGSQKKLVNDERLLLVQVFQLIPEAGINELFAEARSAHGVNGRSQIFKASTPGFRSPGKLHVLGVGIDSYRNANINLDFAVTDARTVIGKVASGAKKQYTQVISEMLADEAATANGVKQLLKTLEGTEPQDSILVVMAGHGHLVDGEWYFLPHDVDLKNIQRTAVSARDIQDALVNAPARNVFLMVDACHSGSGIDTFNKYRAFQQRMSQQMGRNAGVTVLTAARRDQLALELTELGHGLFTHTVLEGLSGAAATKPSDHGVTAHGLAVYVGEHMESNVRKFFSSNKPGDRGPASTTSDQRVLQSPAYFVIGSDFFVSGL